MVNNKPSRLEQSLQRFEKILTKTERDQILAIQDQPLPTGIRLNPLKVQPEEEMPDLAARYGWRINPVPFCDHCWAVQKADISPGGTLEHRMGQYYLQDLASLVPVSLFDFDSSPNQPLILDLAASPGGKTTHLISRSKDRGLVIANDASKGRIPALRSVLAAWGGINQIITQFPGESFGAWYPETFDLVLLDAPCSMENLRPTPNHPLRETTPSERQRLGERQGQLLASALAALKPGGQLVYATCSLAPEEDEAVLDRLLNAYPGAIQIEEVSNKLSLDAPGLTHYAENTYHPDLVHALRLWPHRTGMSGFFCALLTKTGTLPFINEPPPARDFSKTDLKPLDPAMQARLAETLTSKYGLNLQGILAEFDCSLYDRFQQLFLIPNQYLHQFLEFPYETIGMPLGRWEGEDLEPAHEFISRFGSQFTRGKIAIPEDKTHQWIAGRDIRGLHTDRTPKGQYLLVTDPSGRNLGLGKLLPKRLRNMLPRGLL